MPADGEIPVLPVADGPGYTFTGDPDDVVLVTPGAVLQYLLPVCCPAYQFFQNVVGNSVKPYSATKQQIIDASLQQVNEMMAGNFVVTAPNVFTYYSLLVLSDDFSVSTDPNDPNAYFFWFFQAQSVIANGITNACGGPPQDSAWVKLPSQAGYFGTKYIVTQISVLNPLWCPAQSERRILVQGNPATPLQLNVGGVANSTEITDDPLKITAFQFLLVTDTGPAMPLPGIPDGYSIPPPLAGVPNPCDSQGPPGPPGPDGSCPGCLSSFADVVTAAGAPGLPDSLFQLFAQEAQLNSPLNPDLLTATVVAMDPAAELNLLNYLLSSQPDFWLPETAIEFADELTFTATYDAINNKASLNVTVPEGGTPVDTVLYTVQVNDCGPDGGDDNQEINYPLTFPVVQAQNSQTPPVTFDQGKLFALILLKLDSLLRCCPPCDVAAYQYDALITVSSANSQASGSVNISDHTPPGLQFGLDEVMFDSFSFLTPIDTTLADSVVYKVGRFWWRYDCNEVSEPMFINLSTEKIVCPGGNIIGFGYALNYGVSLRYSLKWSPRPGVTQW